MSTLLPTTVVGSYPQPEWLIDRGLLTANTPPRVRMRQLWRVAGQYSNISIFDVADHDELHAILSTLPLFPFMAIQVTPLARHPSAVG